MAAQSELAKQETRNRIASLTRRFQTANLQNALVRKATVLTTAGIYGALNRMDVPVTVAGIPWKLIIGPGAMLVEGLSKGALQAGAAGVADATLAIWVERAISTDTLIAGEHDDPDGDPDAEV